MVHADSGRLHAVLHCHTSDWSSAIPLIEKGHLISFTGIVTFKSATVVQEAAAQATAGRFMVETDAPYLAPMPHRGKTNEPGWVVRVAETLASVRSDTLQTIAARTTENACRLFQLP